MILLHELGKWGTVAPPEFVIKSGSLPIVVERRGLPEHTT